ncbi:hypothetical protein ACFLEY_47855 (plasmid) [Bradyrhizobium sp. YCK136]|uniref:Uncharacterized protein n=1 Tax=Bradyrhizobium diazoefficiens TaxID=1355477 RepID=A0A0E3VXU7_9BRAD|nr:MULTISPECIES: hypothetical protein [Bradyrhizobium]BAR63280.1 putative uncharacterized protein [Bradyrhizobium diazoefficiens]MBR0884151.1 hypothetical protein [Bradyrhizobium liaoningense]MBR1070844.1 hypothetical protein [Bradyrhizobium liaoningense]MCD9825528.1 hypothetical protein [Bradyrhizobium japonicum]MCD9898480.1 hypothetical protein [Bradyrhizobium japonicum]
MINAMSGYQPYTSANSVGNVLPGGLSLCSIMVLVLMERYGIYQDLIRSAYDDMQARNNLLKDMNKALSVLRTNRPTDEKAAKDYGTFVDSQGTTQHVFEWMREKGIPIEATKTTLEKLNEHFAKRGARSPFPSPDTQTGGKRGVQSQFDAAINNLKASIDGANSEGEMAMIHLQGLLGKHNDVAALMSNLLSRDQKIKEMIIGNFR